MQEIQITLWGYGGEIVLGTINQDSWDYWSQQDPDRLSEWVTGSLDESEVPEAARFVEPGAWYECDDLVHHNGVEMSSACGITVTDVATGQTLLDARSLDPDDLLEWQIQAECQEDWYASLQSRDTKCFFGQSIEKGTFFEAQHQISGMFDPAKIVLHYKEIEGINSLSAVFYDGEEVQDGGCCDTVGKAMHFAVLDAND